MSELHRITIDPMQGGGRPSIRGLRIRVKDVLDLLAAGATQSEILSDYPYLQAPDISAALEYAARQSDHPVLMRFIVDAQLPPALARWLSQNGHEAEHVSDLGLQSASDSDIWSIASRLGAAIITKDEDFAQRKALKAVGPPIVWVRQPNTRTKDLLVWFERAAPNVVSALE